MLINRTTDEIWKWAEVLANRSIDDLNCQPDALAGYKWSHAGRRHGGTAIQRGHRLLCSDSE
jgi:hypothetical protein